MPDSRSRRADLRRQRADRPRHRLRHLSELEAIRSRRRDCRRRRSRRRRRRRDAGARTADGARRHWPPVVAVTQSFDETVARALVQMRVADFLVKPVSPVELVRTCARVAKSAAGGADRSADLHLPAGGRRRRRHDARGAERDDAAQLGARGKSVDLPRRSRFPARRLRRLSRPRTAPQSRRDRAAAGTARPATARSDAVASSVRPGGGRGAEPSGGNALVRSRHGDAASRSRVVAISITWCSTCRAPGSPGPTACCSAPTSCSSSAK